MASQGHVTIDFETRSEADIKKVGAWIYSKHPSTEVLCLAYIFPDGRQGIWRPFDFEDFPSELKKWIESGKMIEAHNVFFEFCIWNHVLCRDYDVPKLNHTQTLCSAAKAAAAALPRKLEVVGKTLGIMKQKDMKGHRVMLKLTKPRRVTKHNKDKWHSKPEDFEKLYSYCVRDTEAELEVSKLVRDLPPSEMDIWRLDQKINRRGIFADKELIDSMLRIIKEYTKKLEGELKEVTEGFVTTGGQRDRILEFLKLQGTVLEGLTAQIVNDTLEDENLPYRARRVLEIRQHLSKSSTKKIMAMLNRIDEDGRIRDHLLYHGAATGRWAGQGIQPQNLPRGTVKNIEAYVDVLKTGDLEFLSLMHDAPMEVISSAIRPILCAPPGKELICADFSAIEARVLLWLVGDERGLKLYRMGADLYKDMASVIYKKPIIDINWLERQLGKQAILGCGYGMGPDKFMATCASYGMNITKEMAQTAVSTYRTRYSSVQNFWYAIENACLTAMRTGQIVKFKRMQFRKMGNFFYIKLPSGRLLSYPFPRLEMKGTPWGEKKQVLTYMIIDSMTKKWVRTHTYGGKLTENVVQAIARDLMVHSMLNLEKRNYEIVLTVHDEVIAEVRKGFGSIEEFEKIMAELPDWAQGCPVAAEGWVGKRYKK